MRPKAVWVVGVPAGTVREDVHYLMVTRLKMMVESPVLELGEGVLDLPEVGIPAGEQVDP